PGAAAARTLQQARSDGALGPRQKADEREADDDEREAGDLVLGRLGDDAGDRRGGGTERNEHAGEADDERHARRDDAPARAALAEARHLDARDGREVAGHERQDAGRDHGDEAGEEGDGKLLAHHASKRASSSSSRRSSAGSSGGPAATATVPAARFRDQTHAPPARATAPTAMPASGSSQASRSKPCVAGTPSTEG